MLNKCCGYGFQGYKPIGSTYGERVAQEVVAVDLPVQFAFIAAYSLKGYLMEAIQTSGRTPSPRPRLRPGLVFFRASSSTHSNRP